MLLVGWLVGCGASDLGRDAGPSDAPLHTDSAQVDAASSDARTDGHTHSVDGRVDAAPVCGDGVVQAGEECDLASRSCVTGCGSGGLQPCLPTCQWAGCMNPPESCNGVDDDCDGVVDNGFACAAGTTVPCTNNCGAPSMGMCSASCAPPGPGSCVNPTEICNGLDDDCDGTIDNEPDADASCSLPDASAICVSGACVVGTCAAGFGDCDGLSATGCETSTTTTTDCGACGQTCAPVNAATASCAGGGCSYACNPGTLDCTSSPPNLDGCESDATSVTTCGGCANDCTTGPNTTSSSCSAGSCSYTCEPGYSDCDAASAPDVNGCECNATACCGGGCAGPH